MTAQAMQLEKTPVARNQYCERIGIEIEGFTAVESVEAASEYQAIPGVTLKDDAGLNQCELATEPCGSNAEAFNKLNEAMLKGSLPEISFEAKRPLSLEHNSGAWQNKKRYAVIKLALAQESNDWQLVNAMTDHAAVQTNFSGQFDPFGEDGVFLINVFNAIMPYFAHMVHRNTGVGKGHLAIWQKFARPERLPQAGRWFYDAEQMVEYIQSTPRLFKQVAENEFVPLPKGETLSINNPDDLGGLWWFLRPKVNPEHRSTYLEERGLPAMPLGEAQKYSDLSISIVESLLQGRRYCNAHIHSMADAQPAIDYVAHLYPQFFPDTFLSYDEWQVCLEN